MPRAASCLEGNTVVRYKHTISIILYNNSMLRYLSQRCFLGSPSGLSFRVKREILVSTIGEILLQPIEKIRFLPLVEMTH